LEKIKNKKGKEKMKRKLYLLICVVMVAGFMVVGCAPAVEAPAAEEPAAVEPAAEEPAAEPAMVYKVSYINADLENPAWNAVGTGFTDKATELGMDAIAVSSSGQAQIQFKHAQDMVTKEYDAVAISGTDSSTANAAVLELNTADIPVWILHIKPDDPNATFVSMVDAQNEGGNYDAGKYIAETYEKMGMDGVAATVTISLARSNGAARHAGFKKAMDEAGIELPDGNIKEAITYTRDESYTFAQDLIAANPNLSIIWCNYDEAVLGAMKAVEDAGKTGEIIVGGFDGSPESLQAVKDGKINVMAIQPLYEHGTIVAQQMYDYLVNGVQPETVSTDCPLVTTENAEAEAGNYLVALAGPTAKFPE
jgi:ABC-type sugar transport system substrate-binding protein